MKTIYLAGRMENYKDKNKWRKQIAKKLNKYFFIYNPVERERSRMNDIIEGDKKDILESDILIVNVNTPSWGTAMEILWGWQLHKKIYVFTENKKINPWIKYHSNYISKNMDKCIEILFKNEVVE